MIALLQITLDILDMARIKPRTMTFEITVLLLSETWAPDCVFMDAMSF